MWRDDGLVPIPRPAHTVPIPRALCKEITTAMSWLTEWLPDAQAAGDDIRPLCNIRRDVLKHHDRHFVTEDPLSERMAGDHAAMRLQDAVLH